MAADEQIIVDIKVEDKEILAADKAIDNLSDSIDLLSKSMVDARKNNKSYKDTLKEIDKQLDEGTLSTEDHRKQTKLLKEEISKNNRTMAETSVELSKQKRARAANIKLVNSEKNALGQLEAKASLLNQTITKQTTATEAGRKEYARLQKELKKTNEQINEQRQAFGDNIKNIGNYKQVLEGLEDVQPGVVGGIRGIGTAFKALLANPIVLLIAVIVGGLKLMFDAFKKSASGSRLLGKAMAGLRGLFAILTKAANIVGEAIEKAFDDPKQAVEDLWESIKKNLVRRMEGVGNLFEGIGEQIRAAFTGSAEDLKKAAEKTEEAFIQIATGMNKEELLAYARELKKVSDESDNLAARFIALEESQRVNRGAARSLEKQIAVLNAEFERLGEIAGDDTRNMQEMKQAAIDAGIAAEQLAKKQVALAASRLRIINQEVSVRRSAGEEIEDLLDQQAEAEVALTDAKSQSAIASQKILIEQNKIERDIFEQNLDILLDVGDKIKTEQEKSIANENLSLDKRRQLLEASKAALTANFSEIKKEYELYGVTAEQINEVINASDAKQTNEKLKALGLNEIANNRLREIILERKQAELDFNDLSKDLSDEEIERKGKANSKIKELDNDLIIEQITDAEKLKDKLIEFQKEKLKLQLSDETLLQEERQALIKASEAKIREIENEFDEKRNEKQLENAEDEKERLGKRKELLTEFFGEIAEITNEFAGAEGAVFARIAEGITEAFEDGKISIEGALGALGASTNAIFDVFSSRRMQDLDEAEAARQRELELAGDSAEAQAKINESYDKKANALKLKQFNADKAKALLDIGIATAVAAVNALASSPPPASFVLAGITTAFGIAQGLIVATKKPPKFAEGTSDIVDIGGSHASGNDVDVWGVSGGKRQHFGKVEKGEAMPVIKKSAANNYMVAKMNGKFSGRGGGSFANGTPDITEEKATITQNNTELANIMTDAIKGVKIGVMVEDITKEIGKKVEVIDNSKV